MVATAFIASVSSPVLPTHSPSQCDCHFAQNTVPESGPSVGSDRSPHAKNNVGCEKCHGGNSTVFESSLRIAGILNWGTRRVPCIAPTSRRRKAEAAVGPFVAFQDSSQHYQLLKTGVDRGPTCSTCHDAVADDLLSPKRSRNSATSATVRKRWHREPSAPPTPGRCMRR